MRKEIDIQARIRDINLGGHVDSVEALRVVDEARMVFFGVRPQHGMPGLPGVLSALPLSVAPLVGSHAIEYRAEMRFAPHQPFRVQMWVGRIGRTSFTVQSELFTPGAAGGATAAAVAETAVVLWDHGSGAPWPINDQVRTALSEYVAAPVTLRPRPAQG